jgi:hypothetical protein
MNKLFLLATIIVSSAHLNAQNVGVGETSPANKLSVKGSLSVGSGYSTTAAPTDGAIIQGNVGIGTSSPSSQLHTTGTVRLAGVPGGLLGTDASGNVSAKSIAGTTNQLDVVTGNGVGGNPTLNIDPAYSAELKANFTLTGGGNFSYISGNFAWSQRFISISNGNGPQYSTSGYFDILMPTSGSITGVGGAATVTATASGIPLAGWQALYYILPIGSNNTSLPANFRIAYFTSAMVVPENWLLLAIVNADDNTLRTGTGVVLQSGQTWTSGIGMAQNAGSGNYIQNGTASQAANFNITGYGYAGNFLQAPSLYAGAERMADGNPYITLYAGNNSSGGIHLLRNDGNSYGYFYADASGIGILKDGSWAVRASGSVNGTNSDVSFFTNSGSLSAYFNSAGLYFNQANPILNASSYFTASGGAYFNSGTVYTEALYQCRGGIHNDNGGFLNLEGGSSAFNGTKVLNNAFIVDYNQNVATGPYLSANAGALTITGNQTTGNGEVNFWNSGNAGTNRGFAFWYYGGSNYIQQTVFRVGANNLTTNGWNTFSDVRFKKNIQPVADALNKVMQISGYTYEMKMDKFKRFDFNSRRHVGFIAQELEKVLPEVVDVDDHGLKSVEYGQVTPLLVEAIKEQQKEIESVRSKISDYGSVSVNTNELWVPFEASFATELGEGQVPVVTVSCNKPNVSMYIAEKNSKGFKLVITSGEQAGLNVDYVAMAHGKSANRPANNTDWNAVSSSMAIPEGMDGVKPTEKPAPSSEEKASAEMKAKYSTSATATHDSKPSAPAAPDVQKINR